MCSKQQVEVRAAADCERRASAMLCVSVTALLLCAAKEARGAYERSAQVGGSLSVSHSVASWDEAQLACRAEGAVLASPVTPGLLRELQALYNTTFYFIGVDSRFRQNKFVSLEGVALDDMPLRGMSAVLEPDDGQCLSMNQHKIVAVQCTARLPYVCYRNETAPDGYTLFPGTGHYYKVYRDKKSWDDAVSACAADRAHLAVIQDKQVRDFIRLQLRVTYEYPHTYIGLRDYARNGTWKTVTGEDFDKVYHEWETQSLPCLTRDCFCGVMYSSGKLDFYACNETRNYICELSFQ